MCVNFRRFLHSDKLLYDIMLYIMSICNGNIVLVFTIIVNLASEIYRSTNTKFRLSIDFKI